MTRYVVLRGFLAIRSPVLRKSQLRKSQVGARYTAVCKLVKYTSSTSKSELEQFLLLTPDS
jgi:hypothetical protein